MGVVLYIERLIKRRIDQSASALDEMTNSSDDIYHHSDPAVQISNAQKDMSIMAEKYSKFQDRSVLSEDGELTKIDIPGDFRHPFETETGEEREREPIGKIIRRIMHNCSSKLLMIDKEELEGMSTFEKVLTFVEFPLIKIRDFTIPPAEEKNYHKVLGAIMPACTVFSVLFFSGLLYEKFKGIPIAAVLLPFGLFVGVFIFFASKNGKYPKWRTLIHLFALIMSVFWIYQIAKILLDFLNFFALNSRLNQVFMGSTLLAWGNSVGDYFSNSAVSKQGFAVMAVTGCFSGQLFNLLVGFGLNILRATLRGEKYPSSLIFYVFWIS